MRHFDGIHPSALIGDGVQLGRDVRIGAGTIVYDNVHLGDGSAVGANCILGEPTAGVYSDPHSYENRPLVIGKGSVIRSGSILYAGSTVGDHFECGHRVTIRECAEIGENVRIGTLSDIQGHCRIGRYTRLHSNVHVGHHSDVGEFVWIFPYVVLTNDPHPPSNHLMGVTVEPFAVIATMSVILPGVRVGSDSLVGASSLVRADVPPEAIVVGNPGKVVGRVHDVKSKVDGSSVYPWRYTFDRGMPWEGMGYEAWRAQDPTTGS